MLIVNSFGQNPTRIYVVIFIGKQAADICMVNKKSAEELLFNDSCNINSLA